MSQIPSGYNKSASSGLPAGTILASEFGRTVRVVSYIGGGGQGDVYKVDYDGKIKALKWYKLQSIPRRDVFERNLRQNVMNGSPTPEFLWPQDVVHDEGPGFGYIMDLRPEGYYDAGDIFLNPAMLPSFRTAIEACLGMCSAFRILHNKGYRYQDVSGGNFFVNPTTGQVLICDNDNVTSNAIDTGILGTPRYMAPEIVVGKSSPTVHTDRHSMSVLIFFMLLLQHPLEGRRLVGMLDDQSTKRIYGSDPLFIFDREDRSNAVVDPNNNARKVWPCLPSHMKSIFWTAFSHQALHNPNRRPADVQWMRELARFRSEVVTCRCGNEVFLDGSTPHRCDSCGALVGTPLCMELPGYSLPVAPGARIYACQLSRVRNAEEDLDIKVLALANRRDPRNFGLQNASKEPWKATIAGHSYDVAPGQIIRAAPGMVLEIDGDKISIANNTHV